MVSCCVNQKWSCLQKSPNEHVRATIKIRQYLVASVVKRLQSALKKQTPDSFSISFVRNVIITEDVTQNISIAFALPQTTKNLTLPYLPETKVNVCCVQLYLVYHIPHYTHQLPVMMLIPAREKQPITPYPPALQQLFLSESAAVGDTSVKSIRVSVHSFCLQ